MERHTKIIKPTNYYLFLLFHVGMNGTMTLKTISMDYEQLGRIVKEFGTGAQVMIPSILLTESQHPMGK